jgi:hypothetical protein
MFTVQLEHLTIARRSAYVRTNYSVDFSIDVKKTALGSFLFGQDMLDKVFL